MQFVPAAEQNVREIHQLAEKIWWPAYTGVISNEQIEFMLNDMYSEVSLLNQMRNGIQFLLVKSEDEIVGFAGIAPKNTRPQVMRIEKLYLLPEQQGKGTGRAFVGEIERISTAQNIHTLELNVNRNNPAYNFYLKNGFEVYQTVDIPYHHFQLNDYIMRKSI